MGRRLGSVLYAPWRGFGGQAWFGALFHLFRGVRSMSKKSRLYSCLGCQTKIDETAEACPRCGRNEAGQQAKAAAYQEAEEAIARYELADSEYSHVRNLLNYHAYGATSNPPNKWSDHPLLRLAKILATDKSIEQFCPGCGSQGSQDPEWWQERERCNDCGQMFISSQDYQLSIVEEIIHQTHAPCSEPSDLSQLSNPDVFTASVLGKDLEHVSDLLGKPVTSRPYRHIFDQHAECRVERFANAAIHELLEAPIDAILEVKDGQVRRVGFLNDRIHDQIVGKDCGARRDKSASPWLWPRRLMKKVVGTTKDDVLSLLGRPRYFRLSPVYIERIGHQRMETWMYKRAAGGSSSAILTFEGIDSGKCVRADFLDWLYFPSLRQYDSDLLDDSN